jgi:hypothetical protein
MSVVLNSAHFCSDILSLAYLTLFDVQLCGHPEGNARSIHMRAPRPLLTKVDAISRQEKALICRQSGNRNQQKLQHACRELPHLCHSKDLPTLVHSGLLGSPVIELGQFRDLAANIVGDCGAADKAMFVAYCLT